MPTIVILGVIGLVAAAGYGFYLGIVNPPPKPIARTKPTPNDARFFLPPIVSAESAPAAERKEGDATSDLHMPKEFDLLDELGRSRFTPLVFPTPKARVAPPIAPEAKGKPGPEAKQVVSSQKTGQTSASTAKPYVQRDDAQYGRAKQKE